MLDVGWESALHLRKGLAVLCLLGEALGLAQIVLGVVLLVSHRHLVLTRG